MRSSTVFIAVAAIAAPALVSALPTGTPADGSQAISLGSVWDIAKDGYDAYEAGKSAYDSFKNNNRRELVEILAREVEDHLRAQGHSPKAHQDKAHAGKHAKGHGPKHHKSSKHSKGHADHKDAAKEHHAREEHYAHHGGEHHGHHGAERYAHHGGERYAHHGGERYAHHGGERYSHHGGDHHRQARSIINDIDDGLKVVGDGASAVSDIHNAWESFKQNHRRSRLDDADKAVNIIGDGANAVTDIHNAYESWRHGRSFFDELD